MSGATHSKRKRKYRTGRDGLISWSDSRAAAWIGLLETQKRLTRELGDELEAEHGLGISGLELLTRLARADDRTMRLSTLAGVAGLSLSRVSRILDGLESRGLVQRLTDPVDSRAKNAQLTPAGLELLRSALKTHFDGVERVFFARLTDEDIETLARVFEAFRR